MVSASGEQYEIACGDQRAIVVEVGGGLRTYEAGGVPVLDGYDAADMCDGARGQTLVPWPNRVKDGTWSWAGSSRQLNLTEPAQHNAIHGLVRWARWECVERAHDAVTVACTSYPQPGYPWAFRVENVYALVAAGVTVRTTITNLADEPAPVACGFHPYLTVGTPTIDTAVLRVPADAWLPTGEQQIPTGVESVDGTPYDFRTPREIGDTEIDYAFTELQRDGDGRARLRLSSPDGSAVRALWVDEAYHYLEVFTGDALPDPSRRRQGLGVEPMTAPPNALADGTDLVVLDPGATWTGSWGIEVG